MSEPTKKRSDFTTAVYVAIGALVLLLVGLGVAAYLGGSGEPQMVYEGFN
ncbi:MAG: hypothetical protein R3F49_04635 [Planctomycetota bacterium]